uniref:Endonuclease/exonuclease/phosphatase domain-containing protein n=1 Tax=Lepisosteus oculatus TaxID=7918 RepID=W5NI02_LEPOC
TLIISLASHYIIDVVCLQETHIENQVEGYYTIGGFDLISSTLDAKFVCTTYVRSNVTHASLISSSTFCDIIQVGGLRIANEYKPPREHWGQACFLLLNTLQCTWVTLIVNTHVHWLRLCKICGMGNQQLSHSPMIPRNTGPFTRQDEYSQDLCWVSTIASQTVLDEFPHSQHRPLLIHVGLQLPLIHSSAKKHWNFRKANWELYSNTLVTQGWAVAIVFTPGSPLPVKSTSNNSIIPCGCRPVFTPCLNEECKALLEEYEASGDLVIADHLIESLDSARRSHWEETTEKLNFTQSSLKCWNLIHRLGAAHKPPIQARSAVSPIAVASHLLQVLKA